MNRAKILTSLIQHLPDKRHSILIGARQVGKTTVVKQLTEHLKKKNKKVYYLTFEDPEILGEVNSHPEKIFNYTFHPEDLKPAERMYVIIDEVQYAANAINLLKFLYDKYESKVKIVATGSSAFYINRDFKDSLAGRKKIFELYTLSFTEFLHFKNAGDLIKEYALMQKRVTYRSLKEKQIRLLFDEYLNYGGYPAVVLENGLNNKKELLAELVNSYMKKDVLEADVREELKFFNLAKILAKQTGSLVNQHELSNTLKTAVGTIENYLYLLRKCFHIHLLPPKYSNIRKELTKMPKIYFHDLGMRNYLCNTFGKVDQRPDKGELTENYTFIRLRDIYGPDALRFWRTADGNEVDFIIEEHLDSGKAYEVKFSETEFKASKYKKFKEGYPGFNLKPLVYQTETRKAMDLLLL
ncbi:MAG: ATP-binding protein [Bacteroidetes bacterium]|nr:ATP-binding protein [Bacteroidota bacterium]